MQILVIGAADHEAAIKRAIEKAGLRHRLEIVAAVGRLTPAVLRELANCDAAIVVVPRGSGFSAETRRECLQCWGVGATPVLAIESGGHRDAREVRAVVEAFAAWSNQLGTSPLLSFEVSETPERMVDGLRRLVEKSSAAQPFRLCVERVAERASGLQVSGTGMGTPPAIGEALVVLPSGADVTVTAVTIADRRRMEIVLAGAPAIASGQVLAATADRPEQSDQVAAHLVWCGERSMLPGRPYEVRIGPQQATAQVSTLKHRLNPLDLDPIAARQLASGEIGLVNLSFATPLLSDPVSRSTGLGRLTLYEPGSDQPVAFGRIAFTLRRATNIHWQALSVDKAARAALKGQKPCCLWFTGLSGSGKSTVASLLEKRLNAGGRHTYTLDGDNVRHGLNRDLGFTDADRVENIRRVSEVAKLFVDAGLIVLVSFISPFRAERRMARDLFPDGDFLEIFVDTPLAICEQRDAKGLYAKARAGALKNFTGIDSPYEAPERADIRLEGGSATPEALVETVYLELQRRGIV